MKKDHEKFGIAKKSYTFAPASETNGSTRQAVFEKIT